MSLIIEGIWDAEAERQMTVIQEEDLRLRELYDIHEAGVAAWLLSRPGRRAIESQEHFIDELRNSLLLRLQMKQRATS